MNSYTQLVDKAVDIFKPRKSAKYTTPVSDTIYSFDIETTSLFCIDGKWQRFNYEISQKDYRNIDKAALCYIWMFGVENTVYYGRELKDFELVLTQISDQELTKVIWVHNLSYEFTFLMNIFYNKYTITDVVAREVKKPIEFKIEELNIIFRCSYMLTNLSLDAAAKEYTDIEKKSGQLDYNVERSPLTKLTDKELEYCEYDILTLDKIIEHYRTEYGHIANIPLTSTGTVRRALRGKLGYWYIKKQQKLVPSEKIYLMLMQAFSGGFTHANVLHSNKVFYEDIESQDIASSYPAVLVMEKYPCKPFIKCNPRQFNDTHLRGQYCFFLRVKMEGLISRFYNHYIQAYKCRFYDKEGKKYDLAYAIKNRKKLGIIFDNGRIQKCDCTIEMIITDIDMDIIQHNYSGKFSIVECYKARKDYLDVNVIKFILELYKNKTSLKGVEEKVSIYKRDKERLNSCFGMAVTNQLKNSCEFDNNVWSHKAFSSEFIQEKLEEMQDSFSTLFFYAVGVWCTAAARRSLMKIVLDESMDKDVIYCDTDSCKFRNREQHQDLFMSYNLDMIERYKNVCERYPELEIKDFMPADKHGVLHPIGFYEFDALYSEFKTLGAKKYCGREEDGELHITVSGVSKKGAVALNDNIENFKKGFKWDYKTSGKKTHYYREVHLVRGNIVDDRQPAFEFMDVDGNNYLCNYGWSIVLMPTTYELGITDIYDEIIKIMNRRDDEVE